MVAEVSIDAKIHSPANLGVTSSGRLPAFRRVPGGGTSTRRHAIGRKVVPIGVYVPRRILTYLLTSPREVLTVGRYFCKCFGRAFGVPPPRAR